MPPVAGARAIPYNGARKGNGMPNIKHVNTRHRKRADRTVNINVRLAPEDFDLIQSVAKSMRIRPGHLIARCATIEAARIQAERTKPRAQVF